MTSNPVVAATQNWLIQFIIAQNICPFARHVHENDAVRYQVVASLKSEDCLQALMEECRYLDNQPGCETTLLIMPETCADFDDFLDFLAIAEQLLHDQGYEGIYQLASFHPDYCFADAPADDPANYTNRSPWPMLHIIREASIEQALRSYENPEQIPERNIELTRKLGLPLLQAQLLALRNSNQNPQSS